VRLSSYKKSERTQELVLQNDDHHSFEFVIASLVEVCGHEPIQAEQCALIAHHNGSCVIKIGTAVEIQSMMARLSQQGLNVFSK